ncbi:BLOC-1-related complex subunit 8 isoform X1 [Tamandua tetradactyla]|uniref:BLOC-1-related complex subunit 8 isoform X1 n=1 Tax=Tamandua tetradactyla TaxID=48850 RepID=UPI004054423E
MEEPEMQLKGKKVTDKFTESVYVLANEPSVALYRLQEHVRRSLPELAQHKADMQRWEEQSQGAIYTVEYACREPGPRGAAFPVHSLEPRQGGQTGNEEGKARLCCLSLSNLRLTGGGLQGAGYVRGTGAAQVCFGDRPGFLGKQELSELPSQVFFSFKFF